MFYLILWKLFSDKYILAGTYVVIYREKMTNMNGKIVSFECMWL